jgi:hypothetical protein
VPYDVVEQHADAFFEGQEERGSGLPRFVREEFEAYLTCGRLERGFIRAKCTGCRHEHHGTTHVLFEPQDFIARLAALVPRPKAHLVRYHGVFAPNARERAGIVARPKVASKASASDECAANACTTSMSWMARRCGYSLLI